MLTLRVKWSEDNFLAKDSKYSQNLGSLGLAFCISIWINDEFIIGYLDKSLVFELSYLTNPNGSFSSIDNVSDDDLKNKIPYYKSLCIDDLIKKCGHEKYNEIVEKYELEV